MENIVKPHIQSISVRKLFGLYNYDLNVPSLKSFDDSIILYGDNGTGKSTILKMTSYLLTEHEDFSNKARLLNIECESFTLLLSNGAKIGLTREEYDPDNLLGKYKYWYNDENQHFEVEVPGRLSPRNDCYVLDSTGEIDLRRNLSQIHRVVNYNILFIADSRKELYSPSSEEDLDYRRRRDSRRDNYNTEDIDQEISELNNWVIQSVFEATKKGEEGAYAIYTKILNQLVRKKKNEITPAFDEVVQHLNTIAEKTRLYESIGFISSSDYQSIFDTLNKIPKTRRESSMSILIPFIESQEAKLKSLDALYNLITYLVGTLNSYLHNKTVSFSVGGGLLVYPLNHPNPIKLSNLSSGERNLLLLLSKVMRRSSDCSVIIIDEPEISLNIKWQRMLIKTLKMLTAGNNVQFIIATHSFEILSGMNKNVVKLEDKK